MRRYKQSKNEYLSNEAYHLNVYLGEVMLLSFTFTFNFLIQFKFNRIFLDLYYMLF